MLGVHKRQLSSHAFSSLLIPAAQPLNGACGGTDANGLSEAEGGGEDGEEEVPVDENLFTGEDLEELDEELNTLALEEDD